MPRRYRSAANRWGGVGPYYAMFPVTFADRVVRRYTAAGDWVLDPFAGRGTAPFSAASQGRHGLGVELNPVGWVFATTKLRPAPQEKVELRLVEVGRVAGRPSHARAANTLPEFFHHCFSPAVLRFLLAARGLDWRRSRTDRTLMALLLVNLHGKRDASLSNQLRQTKAMAPDYAVNWWRERGLTPPDVDPVMFLKRRIGWRYANGTPGPTRSQVYLGDTLGRLPALARRHAAGYGQPVRLLLNSPPYFGLTNYHYDQWLRLWLPGGRPDARRVCGRHRGKFEHRERYRDLLTSAFAAARLMLAPDATVYVRTGRQRFTLESTAAALRQAFPARPLRIHRRPFRRPTQTRLFGDHLPKAGEVDLVMPLAER